MRMPSQSIPSTTYPIMALTRISVKDLFSRMESGELVLFINCRDWDAWMRASMKPSGAERDPMDEIRQRLAETYHDCTVVIYCRSPEESSCAHSAQLLNDYGYERVCVLEGGFDPWEQAWLPLEPKD